MTAHGVKPVVWDVDLLSEDMVKSYKASDPERPVLFRRGDIADAEPAVPEMARALYARLAPQSQTHNALVSSPRQHALYVIIPGYSLAPVLDSHSLSASLVYWPHRSALLQTSAAATSHRVDVVRDALSRGGLDGALTSEPAGHSTPGLMLSGAL